MAAYDNRYVIQLRALELALQMTLVPLIDKWRSLIERAQFNPTDVLEHGVVHNDNNNTFNSYSAFQDTQKRSTKVKTTHEQKRSTRKIHYISKALPKS